MKKSIITTLILALCALLPISLASSANALAGEYDSAGATTFTFTNHNIAATKGNYAGYKIEDTALTISEAGTYIVSGNCTDGSITIKKEVDGVILVLNGLELSSSDTAPITCNKASRVTIIAAAGTNNTLTDAAYNNDETYPDNLNAENAVIKCKDGSQVTICGSGILNINANGKNGIKSGATTDNDGEAWLNIQEAELNIQVAVNDGINAEQLLNISSGKLTIEAADDGIHCDYTMNIGQTDTEGPTINVTNCEEGLEAATLNIYSGNIIIHAQDDCLNAANSDLSNYKFALNIAGGTLTMDTVSGDGIDSNGDLTISGGTTVVWSASKADNQPLDADGLITITGGTVLAAGGSAGMGINISSSQPYVTFGNSFRNNKPDMQPDMQPEFQPDTQPDFKPDMQPDFQPNMQPDTQPGAKPDMQPNTKPDMPEENTSGGKANRQPDTQAKTANNPANGLSQGAIFTIKDSREAIIYNNTAVCNAAYVFFTSDKLEADNSYTLYSGDTSIASATAQNGIVNNGFSGNGGRTAKSRIY